MTNGIRDDWGNEHPPIDSPPRIVSLVPSITELLFAIQLGSSVVGRTTYCIRPHPKVQRVPSVGGTKRVDFERAIGLKPTHVIVNVDENTRETADRFAAEGIPVIVTHPITAADNLRLYEMFGSIFGRSEEAEALAGAFRAAWDRLQHVPKGTRRVLYLIWRDPWMTVARDTYIANMLGLIDWTTIPVDASARYPIVELPAALESAERILLSSEPYPFGERDVARFEDDFPDTAGRVRLVDGQLLSWYGPRAIAGLDYLAELATNDTAD